MDLQETSQAIMKLSVAERIMLVEEIWDSIAAERGPIELTEAQTRELDRRLDAYQAAPQGGSSWGEVKSRILAQK
jgi:putative addiction module component (TIGR02574 family)